MKGLKEIIKKSIRTAKKQNINIIMYECDNTKKSIYMKVMIKRILKNMHIKAKVKTINNKVYIILEKENINDKIKAFFENLYI